MLTYEQARELVVADLRNPAFAILDAETIELPWGWVFFYQSKRFIETGDIRDALAGNAPYLVNRLTGEFALTGTSVPVSILIENYERLLQTRTPNNG